MPSSLVRRSFIEEVSVERGAVKANVQRPTLNVQCRSQKSEVRHETCGEVSYP